MYAKLMASKTAEPLILSPRLDNRTEIDAPVTAGEIITIAVYDDAVKSYDCFLSVNFDGLSHLRQFIVQLSVIASSIASWVDGDTDPGPEFAAMATDADKAADLEYQKQRMDDDGGKPTETVPDPAVISEIFGDEPIADAQGRRYVPLASDAMERNQTVTEPVDDDDDDDDSFTPCAAVGTADNPIIHNRCASCGNNPCTCGKPETGAGD